MTGDRRDQAGRGLNAVDFLDMALDFTGRHAARIHADDLGVELRETALIFGDENRIKAAVPVSGMSRTTLPLSVVTVFWLVPLRRFGGWFATLRRRIGTCFSQMLVQFRA